MLKLKITAVLLYLVAAVSGLYAAYSLTYGTLLDMATFIITLVAIIMVAVVAHRIDARYGTFRDAGTLEKEYGRNLARLLALFFVKLLLAAIFATASWFALQAAGTWTVSVIVWLVLAVLMLIWALMSLNARRRQQRTQADARKNEWITDI